MRVGENFFSIEQFTIEHVLFFVSFNLNCHITHTSLLLAAACF